MDYSQIKDPVQLKSLAYDQIAAKEQAEINLRAINEQLRKVLTETPAPTLPGQPSEQAGEAKTEEPTPPQPPQE